MNLSQLTGEDKLLLDRLMDLDNISGKGHTARFSSFLSEHQVLIAQQYIKNSGAQALLYGGYSDAERKMAGFFPSWQEPTTDGFPIRAVTLHPPKGAELNHRDYLGSLMSLRITRESIGDIVQNKDRCVLFVQESVAPVILEELRKVGGTGVRCESGGEDIIVPEQAYTLLRGTVASLRLDSLVKLLTNTSREKSAVLIRGELVKLNHTINSNISQQFVAGDIVAIRGYGKYKVDEIGGPTKKGRLPVICRKYA